jgi:hypothetical protein
MSRFFSLIVMLLALPAMAQQFAPPPPPPPPPPQAVPNVPPPPPPMRSGEVMEPGVTIIQTDNETIYEYRAGSHLYMVRVVPKAGPPYYFYDMDGDGDLDVNRNDPRHSNINMWEIFRW